MNWQTRPVEGSQAASHSGGSGIAVCLGSSYLGFYAHSGFLRGLEEQGVRPDHLSGCSAGALVAGLRAGGVSAAELPGLLVSIPMPAIFFDWQTPARGFAMLASLRGISGMTRGHYLLRFLKKIVGEKRIESLESPSVAISATNLSACESALLTSGPLADSIIASCAIPLLVNAVEIEGQYYCDGGIANSLPVGHLADNPGIHTVIVHHVIHPGEKRSRDNSSRPTVATTCHLAAQIIYKRIYQFALEKLTIAGKRVIYCETITSMPSVFLGKKSRLAYIEAGSQTAGRHRAEWESLIVREPQPDLTR